MKACLGFLIGMMLYAGGCERPVHQIPFPLGPELQIEKPDGIDDEAIPRLRLLEVTRDVNGGNTARLEITNTTRESVYVMLTEPESEIEPYELIFQGVDQIDSGEYTVEIDSFPIVLCPSATPREKATEIKPGGKLKFVAKIRQKIVESADGSAVYSLYYGKSEDDFDQHELGRMGQTKGIVIYLRKY